MSYNYLSVGADAKTVKGQKKGYLTGILYMAPHTLGGGKSLCPFSTAGCRSVCLYSAGRGAFNSVQQARIKKTQLFLGNPTAFVSRLHDDIDSLMREARKKGLIPAVRLNGTTDILWEKHGIPQAFPELQFYDYTKYPPVRQLPKNYHMTYSLSEHQKSEVWSEAWNKKGSNTAVVFFGEMPERYLNRTVINGDETDLRFTDPPNVIVGLKVKGKARHDDGGGFVHRKAA